MWINTGDKVKKDGQVLKVLNIEGLYSVASNIKITLENETTKEVITMPFISEFSPQVEKGEIQTILIQKKNSRGY